MGCLAVREGLLFGIENGLRVQSVETDCLQVVSCVLRRDDLAPEFPLIEDIVGLLEDLLRGVGEDGPGLDGVGEAIVVGVEEEGEAALLGGNELEVAGVAGELKDGVPVGLVVDPELAGEERVVDRDEVGSGG
ncbi:hypothetical protein TIFTF001_022309 [Ficus carica]|uniref:Uncharacterized protein n=1 Tax=Ficus carica TaxID=3494 RepID=A0AA88AEB0_FICCA|nr:hypothetical protein TIFTF001_022309 [Ficus carica]